MNTATDLDGNPRIVKGHIHAVIPRDNWRVDMGAYEYQAPPRGFFMLLQ